MPIDLGTLRKFVAAHKDLCRLTAYAPKLGEVIVSNDNFNILDVIDNATVYVYNGKEYGEREFRKIIDAKIGKS